MSAWSNLRSPSRTPGPTTARTLPAASVPSGDSSDSVLRASGRVGLGRRAVDLVGQEERREDRTPNERELAGLEIEDVRPGDIGGHQIRGELDAAELASEDAGQGAHQERLGDAGHSLDEGVVPREDRDERPVDRLVLPDDHLAHLAPRLLEDVQECAAVSVHK